METVPAKTIVTRNKSAAWFGTDYNMNLYRGCSHGCIYCDSRSHCYQIDDFGRVRAKERALEIVRDDLRRKVKKGVVGTGAMSDPYNPFEKEQRLTRNALELINAYGFGAAIATKGDLVTRDADILRDIRAHSPVLVKLTITSTDEEICRYIEPNAPSAKRRFQALEALAGQGIPCGVLMMPLLPWITDAPENIRAIVRRAADCGARFIYPSLGLTMRDGQREYFYKQLDRSCPGLSRKYAERYGSRYQCGSPHARALWELFQEECGSRGILYKMPEIIRMYRQGYEPPQLTWF